MAAGDHLFVSYGVYTHHGIDLGDGTVAGFNMSMDRITRDSFEEFQEGRTVRVREYAQCDPSHVVVARALQRVGESGYDLLSNNCEHFATWCKTGRSESAQVRTVLRHGTATGAKVTAKVAAKILARASTRLGAKAIARAASPWLLLTDVVQLGAEVASSHLGAAPDRAELAGRGVGFVGSLGIGATVGGPMGAGVGAGLWLLGEIAGAVAAGRAAPGVEPVARISQPRLTDSSCEALRASVLEGLARRK